MVSVEAAVATVSLLAVLALILAALSALLLELRCVDAAGEAARLASRGDVDGARRAGARLTPDGAGIVVATHGEDVVVTVAVAPLGSALPGLRVSAGATAAREPDAVASGDPGRGEGSAPDLPQPALPEPAPGVPIPLGRPP